MEVKLRKRKGKSERTTLYLSWWINERNVSKKSGKVRSGKWHIEPLKLYLYPGDKFKAQNKETLHLADTIRMKRQLELNSGSYGEIPEHKKRGDFILFMEKIAKEKDSCWGQAVRVLKIFSPDPIPFNSLNSSWAIRFQNFLLKNYKHNFAWLVESKVRAGIRMALIDELIPKNFLLAVKPTNYIRPPHDYFTEAEIEKLINTPFPENPDVRRAGLFSIFTGLRWCDYSQLIWRNIQDGYICFKQEKTNEATQIPLNESAKQVLFGESGKVINPDKRIFDLPNYNRFLKLLRRWKCLAGITKKFTTHFGRHSYGHLLAKHGVDTYRIQQALGQKTMSAALVYTHLVKGELKRDLDEKLPSFMINREAK